MKLIINADDYGYTSGINKGIRQGMINGIITSTTVLSNCSIDQDDIDQLKQIKHIGIGLHLNLTLEKPLSHGKSIQDSNGYFYDRKKLDFEKLNLDEVEQEFRAQINQFITYFNQNPTHFDSHHSIHDHPKILPLTHKLMQEYQVPARRLSNIPFVGSFFGENATLSHLMDIIKNHQSDSCIEVMTHSGCSDDELRRKSSYSDLRENELNILMSQEIQTFITKQGVELTYYGK